MRPCVRGLPCCAVTPKWTCLPRFVTKTRFIKRLVRYARLHYREHGCLMRGMIERLRLDEILSVLSTFHHLQKTQRRDNSWPNFCQVDKTIAITIGRRFYCLRVCFIHRFRSNRYRYIRSIKYGSDTTGYLEKRDRLHQANQTLKPINKALFSICEKCLENQVDRGGLQVKF